MSFQVHLLDATYELFRHFFAIPSRRSPGGAEVGAVWGVVQSVLSLLRQPEVTHLGAATDHVIESFRNDLFAGYKTGEGIPVELEAQFPTVEEALEALGVKVWRMVEHEADDGLATAAARLGGHPEVSRVVILSPDKDLAQCVVGERVVCHDRRQGKTLDATGVEEKFGVLPASIPDWLALVGDAADGIPGIPGWGPRSAAVLLARYRHLDEIPEDVTRWDVKVRGAARLAGVLSERRSDAILYRTLATLRRDAAIACEPRDVLWRGVRRGPFEELCGRLGFGDLARRPHRYAGEE